MREEYKSYRYWGGCMTVYMCQNSLNYMLKLSGFDCEQVIPQLSFKRINNVIHLNNRMKK